MCEMGFGMYDKEMVDDQEQRDGAYDKGTEGNRGGLGAGMVKRKGLIGRTWDRLSDQQKMGIIIMLVANVLMSLLALVPQVGLLIAGFVYVAELIFFIVYGAMMIFGEEETW